MNTIDFIREHFDSALNIHDACDKLGLTKDDARLMTYIHCKLLQHNNDYAYFEREDKSVIEALEFLLDKKPLEESKDERATAIVDLPKRFIDLDVYLRDQYGMEIRIHSELLNRLRLHTDKKFCEKMMKMYREKILPCLKYKAKVS
ncbi:MAG: hypothetical protein JW795_10940 [Chitinivibrionales bacterium]|nr:hypothetical protein [Chitinivibrionales bacterium]